MNIYMLGKLLSKYSGCIFLITCLPGIAYSDSDAGDRTALESQDQSAPVFDQTELARAFRKNTLIRTGEEDLESIPAHAIYGNVIARIIWDDALLNRFDPRDRDLILSVPSHSAPQFLMPMINDIEALCYIAENAEDTLPGDHVKIFAEALSDADRRLDDYYLLMYEALSYTGQEIVESLKADLSQPDAFSHSSTDIIGIYAEAPHIASALVQSNCENIEMIRELSLNSYPTLADEIRERKGPTTTQ